MFFLTIAVCVLLYTAVTVSNFPRELVKSLPQDFKPGVYYGWAQVNSGPVHKMVANIGWCPFYQNKELSVETHVIHVFEDDFYGSILKVCMIGYLRPEMNFTTVDDLIQTIKKDIENTLKALEDPEAIKLKDNEFFITK